MNAYSKDLRLRVLGAVDRGLSREEISNLFGISRSTIKRWVKRRREGEDLEPRHSTGRKRSILATVQERRALWKQLEENDEATLEHHCELRQHRRGVRVSLATMSRAIREKLGWTFKKRRWLPPQSPNETKKREVLSPAPPPLRGDRQAPPGERLLQDERSLPGRDGAPGSGGGLDLGAGPLA